MEASEESEEPASAPSRSSTHGSPNSSLCKEVIQSHGDMGEDTGSPEIKVKICVFEEPGVVTVSPTAQENCVHDVVHIGVDHYWGL